MPRSPLAKGHQVVQMWRSAALGGVGRILLEQPLLQARDDVQDLIADRYAHPRRLVATCTRENAEGQVLDRKVAARRLRRLHP